jgi:hypothetical protein
VVPDSAIVSGGALWHQATQREAIQERLGAQGSSYAPLAEDFLQLSYLIRHRKGERVSDNQAFQVLEKLNTASAEFEVTMTSLTIVCSPRIFR